MRSSVDRSLLLDGKQSRSNMAWTAAQLLTNLGTRSSGEKKLQNRILGEPQRQLRTPAHAEKQHTRDRETFETSRPDQERDRSEQAIRHCVN